MDSTSQYGTESDSNASGASADWRAKRSVVIAISRNCIQPPFAHSPIARANFIKLLTEGMTISAAAQRTGTTSWAIASLRRSHPEFDQCVHDAIELGTEAVQARLREIALTGDAESMATVRAAEVYLKGTHSAYRPPNNPRRASAKITRVDADGNTYTISATADGIPD